MSFDIAIVAITLLFRWMSGLCNYVVGRTVKLFV